MFLSFRKLKNEWFEQGMPFDLVKSKFIANRDYWLKVVDAKFSLKKVVQ
jgi:hypothetical protein